MTGTPTGPIVDGLQITFESIESDHSGRTDDRAATTSQGDTVSTSTVVWHIETSDYAKWTQRERRAVEQFLRDHDIAPRDVLVDSGGTPIVARLTDTGAYQIELWVVDDDANGNAVRCPTCPCCVRQKFITREVTTAFPLISTAWTAETVHFAEAPNG